jgi:hypothetical protein
MSNVRLDDDSSWVSDLDAIGRVARTKADRREALDVCLEQYWVDENIGRLERVDDGEDHGWEMWRWQAESS